MIQPEADHGTLKALLGRSVAFLGAEACQEISFLGGLVAHN
jgi:hypothetical protein